MTNFTRRTAVASAGIFTALVLAACASQTDSSTAPVTAVSRTPVNNTGQGTGFVRVCKAAGPLGTYSFNTSVVGGGAHVINFGQGAVASLDFQGTEVCVNSGSYIQLGTDASWTAGLTGTATVFELVPAGLEVEKIEVWNANSFPFVLEQTVTGSNTASVTVTATSRHKILYFNREAPPPHINGRMTGGGNQITVGGLRISR